MALIGVFDRSPWLKRVTWLYTTGVRYPLLRNQGLFEKPSIKRGAKKVSFLSRAYRELVEKRFELMDRCTHRRDFKCARDDDGNGWSQKLA